MVYIFCYPFFSQLSLGVVVNGSCHWKRFGVREDEGPLELGWVIACRGKQHPPRAVSFVYSPFGKFHHTNMGKVLCWYVVRFD